MLALCIKRIRHKSRSAGLVVRTESVRCGLQNRLRDLGFLMQKSLMQKK